MVYLATLAPGVTFWDAGEFIAAAHDLGIPHPPGTPLYVLLGHLCIAAAGWALGDARAMNLVSAMATALAGGGITWLVAREARAGRSASTGAIASGLLVGLMCSTWANATETEVYALALLHVVLMLACAARADDSPAGARWLALTAYAIALAPALHLSALVGAPAAAALAGRTRDGRWRWRPIALLGGVMVATAGVGRMSSALVTVGLALAAMGAWREPARWRALASVPLAASALLVLLVRARHDPGINQGNPATWTALADVVARRQYAVAGLWPRQAPPWLQAANVAQYADWQVAMGWGHGVFTTPARVAATLAYLLLGVAGWRAMRRDAPRLAVALLVLAVCGSAGVTGYLNLKAGASLGWGLLPDGTPHEARERDYFFVFGFVAWACLAGAGALALARRIGRPRAALLAALVPLVGNWSAVTRRREPEASAPRALAAALLAAAPPHALLFTSGDNDSYPLWYLQRVEGARPDVQLVTLPLLPAGWYQAEIARRSGLAVGPSGHVAGAEWLHEEAAAAIARAAFAAGRPVAASPGLLVRERAMLGGGWVLRGPLYVASRSAGEGGAATVDSAAARAWLAGRVAAPRAAGGLPDDVTATMLGMLECPRLGVPWTGSAGGRDSLEVSCNFR